ncbi:hypothetical protein EMCRGX_G013858 [Ephydatia muelleri]
MDTHVRDGDGHVMQGWTRTSGMDTSGMDTHVRDGDGHIMRDGHARQGWTRQGWGWTRQGWTRTVLKRIKKDDLEENCVLSPTKNLEFFHVSTLSFCGQSLHKEIERSGTKQSMECPTCQRSITIPEGGINAVPQNLHLGFEGERYPYGGLQVKAELRPKSHDGAVVPGKVEDYRDGTYTINLTPQALVLTSSSSQWMVNITECHGALYGNYMEIERWRLCPEVGQMWGWVLMLLRCQPCPQGIWRKAGLDCSLCVQSKEGFLLSAIITMATTSGTLLLVHLDIRCPSYDDFSHTHMKTVWSLQCCVVPLEEWVDPRESKLSNLYIDHMIFTLL